MKAVTFVHTADCHLDAPFLGIGREDPALAERLRKAQRAVFDSLIDLCLERKAAFLLVAGDLYDVAERSLTTRVQLREAFRRLADAKVEVFLATGNHDNLAETQRGMDFPPNVHIFSPDQPESFLWPTHQPLVSISGISYGRRAIEENLAERFPQPRQGLFNIAVLHCNVDGDPAHDNYAPCRLDDLLRAGYDYWALGHVHQIRRLREGRPGIVYPGCLQGRKTGEIGEKGAIVATFDEYGELRLEAAPLHRIEWADESVAIDEVVTDEQLAEVLRDCAEELRRKTSPRVEGLIVRWRLAGRLGCDMAARRRVLESLRESAFDHMPFVWTQEIDTSATTALFDLESLAEEPTPRGDLVRLVREIQQSPDKVGELLAKKSGPPAIAREFGITDRIEAVLDEALWLGLDLLSRRR